MPAGPAEAALTSLMASPQTLDLLEAPNGRAQCRRPGIGTSLRHLRCYRMPDFQFQLLDSDLVVETETQQLGSFDEVAEFAYQVAESLKTQGWVDDDQHVQLAVLDQKGQELFRLRVV
jgi:hypothetical protein